MYLGSETTGSTDSVAVGPTPHTGGSRDPTSSVLFLVHGKRSGSDRWVTLDDRVRNPRYRTMVYGKVTEDTIKRTETYDLEQVSVVRMFPPVVSSLGPRTRARGVDQDGGFSRACLRRDKDPKPKE